MGFSCGGQKACGPREAPGQWEKAFVSPGGEGDIMGAEAENGGPGFTSTQPSLDKPPRPEKGVASFLIACKLKLEPPWAADCAKAWGGFLRSADEWRPKLKES